MQTSQKKKTATGAHDIRAWRVRHDAGKGGADSCESGQGQLRTGP